MFMAQLMRKQLADGVQAEAVFREDAGGARLFPDGHVRVLWRTALREQLATERYSLVHVCAHAAEWASAPLQDSHFGGALVVTSHALGDYRHPLREHAVVAVAHAVAKAITPPPRASVSVIHNGIDCSMFRPPPQRTGGRPIAAWVGRSVDPRKGLERLIEVAERELAGFQLMVVDGSPEGEDCRDRLPPDAAFQARMPREDMPAFYQRVAASKGFVFSTSLEEGCPLTLLEAMACGCPVIAPAVGGIPEIVRHEETGYLCGSGEGGVVRQAMQWLYAGDTYARVAAAAADHVVRHHSLDAMWVAYRRIYRCALRRRAVQRVGQALRRRAGFLWKE